MMLRAGLSTRETGWAWACARKRMARGKPTRGFALANAGTTGARPLPGSLRALCRVSGTIPTEVAAGGIHRWISG